jgi:hypothetical protein
LKGLAKAFDVVRTMRVVVLYVLVEWFNQGWCNAVCGGVEGDRTIGAPCVQAKERG